MCDCVMFIFNFQFYIILFVIIFDHNIMLVNSRFAVFLKIIALRLILLDMLIYLVSILFTDC